MVRFRAVAEKTQRFGMRMTPSLFDRVLQAAAAESARLGRKVTVTEYIEGALERRLGTEAVFDPGEHRRASE
jgi:hypothetical protein